MPSPIEVVDDLTVTATTGKLQYTVRKPPYLAGSVSVFRNGLLQDPAFFTEDDPEAGTITLCEPILIRDNDDHSVHVAYGTFQPVFVDLTAPIHISQLKLGNVLRIAMRAGRHLEPVVRKGQNQLLAMKSRKERSIKTSGRVARNFARTTFLGYLTANDPVLGELQLQVEGRDRIRRRHLAATVRYSDILSIRKYITPSKPHTNSPVGGGQRAVRRPGANALGVLDAPGFMNLVRVVF